MRKRLITRKIKEVLLATHDLRDLKRERENKGKELAASLCPFKIGEVIRVPNPEWYRDCEEGKIEDIRLDTHYGYELVYVDATPDAPYCPGIIPGERVRELERFNHKAPVVPPDEMDSILRPLNEPYTGYYA